MIKALSIFWQKRKCHLLAMQRDNCDLEWVDRDTVSPTFYIKL